LKLDCQKSPGKEQAVSIAYFGDGAGEIRWILCEYLVCLLCSLIIVIIL
jgi:hypothetical protein